MQLFVSYGNKVRWMLILQMNKKVWKVGSCFYVHLYYNYK